MPNSMPRPDAVVDGRQLAVFATVLILIASGGYWLAIGSEANLSVGLLIVQFAPMLAAFAALLMYQRNLRGIGWALGRVQFYVLALLLPLLMVSAVFALLVAFGLVRFDAEPFLTEAQTAISGLFGWAPATMTGTAFFVLAVNGTIGLVAAFPAIGEEIGWRGFLAPRLTERLGFGRSSVLIGVLWAVYHYPLIHFLVAPSLGLASWPILLTSLVGAIALTFILNWLRLASASVWPAVIFHAALNVHYQGFFQPMATPVSPTAAYIANDYGGMIALVAGCTAFTLLLSLKGIRAGRA